MKNFAEVARPLYRLLEKSRPFTELKNRLTSAPILAFPDVSKPFILDTDASDSGIGAVLSSMMKMAARSSLPMLAELYLSQRGTTVTQRELLAVVYFTHHF